MMRSRAEQREQQLLVRQRARQFFPSFSHLEDLRAMLRARNATRKLSTFLSFV